MANNLYFYINIQKIDENSQKLVMGLPDLWTKH